MMKPSATAMVSVLALLAAGCGGGDGGGAPTPTPTPTPAPTSFSFSGTLSANQFLRVDSDINDFVRPPVSNGDATVNPGDAQPIANPAIISGFVTELPTGPISDDPEFPPGNFEEIADPVDIFSVSASAGQFAVLEAADFDIANPAVVDLDLFLFTATGDFVAASLSVTSLTETIMIPADGDYLLAVNAFSGASNYTLTLSSELATPAVYTQINVADVMPGVLSVEGEPRTAAARGYVTTYADHGSLGVGALRGAQMSGLDSPRLLAETRALLGPRARDRSSLRALHAAMKGERLQDIARSDRWTDARLATMDLAKRLNRLEGGDTFKPAQYARTLQVSSDPVPDPFLQWNLYDVDFENAQALAPPATAFENPPVIAVLDSGVFNAHPDIAGAVVDQRDFVTADIDGDGFDADAEQDVDPFDPDPGNCHVFHGSHVSSTATAPQNGTGITGVLPDADLIAIKLSYDLSTGPQGDLCRLIVGDLPNAIRYAAQLPNASGALPPVKADVINMSLGSLSFSAAINAAVQDAINAGVVVVASAGNAGGTPEGEFPNFPAALDNVVAVAATDLRRQPAFYSSSYPEVDIAAPGGNSGADLNGDGIGDGIVAAVGQLAGGAFEPGFELLNGTSMAAPHVAAGLAMMRAINPDLTPQQINALISNGDLTIDIGAPGKDNATGFGLMSLSKMAEAALDADGGAPPAATVLVTSPSRLDFGPALETITVEVDVAGPGALTVTAVTGDDGLFLPSGESWVTVAGPGGDGLGTYQFFVDRAGLLNELGPGGYTGALGFERSDGGVTTLPVSVLVGAEGGGAETAPVFVLAELLNAETGEFETVEQFTAIDGAAQSTTVVTFPSLPGGDYRLVFGTDMDNDGFICDDGELCGTFPFVESSFETQFTLDADIAGATLLIADQSNAGVSTLSGAPMATVQARPLLTAKAPTKKVAE